MGYFPFFMEIKDQPGVIIGGGTVALHKVEKLLPYAPRLTVIAPKIRDEFTRIPGLTLLHRSVRPEDLDSAFFVIAATGDRVLNHSIAARCRDLHIPVNVVDDKDACTFLFPALVQQGLLSVGISTSGASPTAAIWLKEQVQALLPPNLDTILLWLEEQRPLLKARFPEESQRSCRFARLFSACLEVGRPLSSQELNSVLQEEWTDA